MILVFKKENKEGILLINENKFFHGIIFSASCFLFRFENNVIFINETFFRNLAFNNYSSE